MDERGREIHTRPARCRDCSRVFVAGVTEAKGAYMMGRSNCVCGCEDFDLIDGEDPPTAEPP